MSLLLLCAMWMPGCGGPSGYRVYIGTYTGTGGKGIYRFDLDAATGHATEPVVAAETPNPSFLAIEAKTHRLYAVGEAMDYQGQKTGSIAAFAIDPETGELTRLNAQSSRGAHPCHLTVDPSGRNVLAANYTGGSIVCLPIREDGSLGEPTGFIQFTHASKVNPARQEGPHAHSINTSPDGGLTFAADLGGDRIYISRLDAKAGTLTPAEPPFAPTPPGGGPRHLAFHPSGRFAYANNEMTSSVTGYRYDARAGSLEAIQTLSTLPEPTPNNSTAEVVVHPNGRFLYVSNRVHDTLAIFRIDPKVGTLTALGHTPTGGKIPRNFAIDPTGRWLLAANQDSDNVVIFAVDAETGGLTPTGQSLSIPRPVCVRFLPW